MYSYKRNGKFYPQKRERDFSRLPKPIGDLFEPIIAALKNPSAPAAPGPTAVLPSSRRPNLALVRSPQAQIVPLAASLRQSGVVLGSRKAKTPASLSLLSPRGSGVSSARGPSVVNHHHNFLGPPHSIRDCTDRGRNSFPAIKLGEFACCEDTGGDQQHTFSALIHAGQFIMFVFCSPTLAGEQPQV